MKYLEREGSANVYPFSNRFSYSAGSDPQSLFRVSLVWRINTASSNMRVGGVVSGTGQDLTLGQSIAWSHVQACSAKAEELNQLAWQHTCAHPVSGIVSFQFGQYKSCYRLHMGSCKLHPVSANQALGLLGEIAFEGLEWFVAHSDTQGG